MFKHLLAFAAFYFFIFTPLSAQDPTLFSVGNVNVPVSEFKYIYAKTNQDKANFSEASLRDYLDLYTKFKLKVMKARDMRLDTIASLQSELDGYRKQLAKSYLEDKEVSEKLIRETYDRMLQDVDISHIFVTCDRNAKPADSLRAYNKAMRQLKLVQSGKDFGQVAIDSSDDKSAKDNKGRLGYVNAMLPDGYYAMEKAVYAAKAGSVVGPVRSNTGYHILKVNAFRPARGEMEVSQILIRKGDTDATKSRAKVRIDSVYQALKGGGKWDELCAANSDDKMTSPKGGYIGFFGINRYQRTFEDAAFALTKDGDYTAPVETSIGWHIIQRKSQKPVGAYETIKKGLADRVKRDSRSEIAKQSMIGRIKREAGFQEMPDALAAWQSKQVDTVFHTFKWKPDASKPQTVLMRFGQAQSYTVTDFEDFCARSGRDRMRGVGSPLAETVPKLYKAWSDEVTMQFEEAQLSAKYPEFKSLMREYEEGILLFEALKVNVWDRANTDSVGLTQFFNTNISQKYKWDERAKVSIYTLKTDDAKTLKKLRSLAAKKPAADVLKKMNKKGEVVTVIEKSYEKGKSKDLGALWSAGAMTEGKTDAGTKTANFMKIESIVPPTAKALSDARGYAVADYQEHLEKQWIEELKKSYPIKINDAVLMGLVKK